MTDSKTQRLQRVQEALDTLDNAEARAALRATFHRAGDAGRSDKLSDHRASTAPRETRADDLAAKIMAG